MHLTEILLNTLQVAPDRTAMIDGDIQYSWQTFLNRIAQLAGVFQSLSLSKGGRIAILMQNNHRFLETYFAVPWANGIFVPINNRLTPKERTHILKDAGVEILIFDTHNHVDFLSLKAEISTLKHGICVGFETLPEGCLDYEKQLNAATPLSNQTDTDIAGLFYTSGTTGQPKGVMLTHENIIHNAQHLLATMSPSDNWTYLHAGPMYHIADGMWNSTITIQSGTHVFVPKFDPESVLAAIQKHHITHCSFVPTMVDLLVNFPKANTYDLSSLRGILYGGAPMPSATLENARKIMPACEFSQGYGLTETAPILTILTWEHHHKDDSQNNKASSVGQAVPGVELQILDAEDEPVPTNKIGEIVARGPNIMKGYWQQPETTAETIRNGWIHTGDMGFLDKEGFLYIVDRLKDMIITGGENVYSVEVENALYQHPSVAMCAVVGRSHKAWGEAVHAVVLLKDGHTATEEDLIAHCRTQIATYKCPRTIEFRSEPLPVTGAGKISKRELRDATTSKEPQTTGTAIRNKLSGAKSDEQIAHFVDYLQTHIGHLLGIDKKNISPHSNFSELGIDSFTVVELTTQIQNDFGISLLPNLFLQPISSVATSLQASWDMQSESTNAIALPTWSPFRRQVRTLSRGICKLLLHFDVQNSHQIPQNGPCLIASNHLHLFDATLMFSAISRPLTFVMHSDWQNAIIKYIYQAIYVHPDSLNASALSETLDILRSGGAISIAPEGQRSKTPTMARGRPGLAYLAIKSGAPIIPVALWGQEKSVAQWKSLKKASVKMQIGEPIFLSETKTDVQSLQTCTDYVMEHIAALLPHTYRGVYTAPTQNHHI